MDYIIRYDNEGDDQLMTIIKNFKKQNLWQLGYKDLLKFSDKVFDKYYKYTRSQFKVTNALKSQEILGKLMFQRFGKNIGMAKFQRGFRRLLKIMRFAKLIGDDINPYFIDIGTHTLFHVRQRQLQCQGLSLMDLDEYMEY